MTNTADLSPLGKTAAYRTQYAPELLFPIPRQAKRDELQLTGTMPFFGVDIWNAYELSWLNMRGKPQVAIATISVPADSPNIIESKSFKLYLNSFNQTRLANSDALLALLRDDLSNGFGAPVHIVLTQPDGFGTVRMGELEGLLRYLIGFREHNEFHEQCVERIFVDILRQCAPQKLAVYARYTRRGGLDINPWRSNFSGGPPRNLRTARQ